MLLTVNCAYANMFACNTREVSSVTDICVQKAILSSDEFRSMMKNYEEISSVRNLGIETKYPSRGENLMITKMLVNIKLVGYPGGRRTTENMRSRSLQFLMDVTQVQGQIPDEYRDIWPDRRPMWVDSIRNIDISSL